MDWTKKKRPHTGSDILPVREVNLVKFRGKQKLQKYRNKTEYDNDEWLIDDRAVELRCFGARRQSQENQER